MKTKDIQDDPIYTYIQDLKREWDTVKKVKTEVMPTWGEDKEVTLYFDPLNCEWTIDKKAFKGFVIRKLQNVIDSVWES